MDPCMVDDGSWTDEKHMHFLDFLESSFLHTMFGASGGGEHHRSAAVRLDRELPDSCESTRDSVSHTRKKKKKKTHLSKGMEIMNKPKKSIRSTTSKRHFYESNDQVVPQFEKRSRDDDEEEKDHHHQHQQQKTKNVGPY